jgi:DNA adenine methylase
MESINLHSVDPVRPVAPYLGGKRHLAKRLVERINAIPHATYAEAFMGMGGVFFRRTLQPESEVINDLNQDVANLFRILQRHYPQFRQVIEFQLTTRADFNRLVATDPTTLTDLERAARFLYLQRTAFGGKVSGNNFGVSVGQSSRFDLQKLGPMLQEVHARLSGVVVECLPYQDFIPRYDRPGTLFYLDPPYFGCETDYGPGMFATDDFERLSDLLSVLSGRFILSINDTPEIREIFGQFEIEEVTVTYTIQGNANTKQAAELIVSGGVGLSEEDAPRPTQDLFGQPRYLR